jgi:hypothetical protein
MCEAPGIFGRSARRKAGNQESNGRISFTPHLLPHPPALRYLSAIIQRRTHPQAGLFHDVSVNHGGRDVFVSEEILEGADVRAGFQKVGGKTVAKHVWSNLFVESRLFRGCFDGDLHGRIQQMMATPDSGPRIDAGFATGPLSRVTPVAAESKIPVDPFHVGLFRSIGVMPEAQCLTALV